MERCESPEDFQVRRQAQQFFGSKEAADEYQAKLVAMDKLGAHAIRAQKIAKMIGWGLAIPAGLKTAGAIAHTAMVP